MSEHDGKKSQARGWLARLLGVGSPFPWQLELLDRMLDGEVPRALDVPTGLGKTAVIAIWLVARAVGGRVPRRLVYVVDRRAVVDQATGVAEQLRGQVAQDPGLQDALGISTDGRLPISTLRGQFLDNREWLEDPSAPAIVLGTVDMIGSRLLFEGYGVSRKMRPYHAGLLGTDTLIVLDEAHLIAPFERLVSSIARASEVGLGPREPSLAALVPQCHLLSLSATGRSHEGTLSLGSADREHPIVARRLAATKNLYVRPDVSPRDLPERLAEEAWARCVGDRPARCIVFCNRRDDARAVAEWLAKRAGTQTPVDIELFVGGRRVWERADAAEWLKTRGFLAGTSGTPEKTAFVVATSAGEVGVDLDADHMVSDLVAWERMVQRLGRVNRRGDGAADVIVIPAQVDDDNELAARLAAVKALIAELPPLAGDARDGSPGALTSLKERARTDESIRTQLTAASTPPPLHPPLTRPLLEAWSMTSLEEHTGRADIQPWLRGWVPEEKPQTRIVWRRLLPITSDGQVLARADLEEFLAAAGPHLAEELETETWRVVDWLSKRAASAIKKSPASESSPLTSDDVIAVIVSGAGVASAVTIASLSNRDRRADLERRMEAGILLVDARVGGLSRGLLADESDDAKDVTELPGAGGRPAVPFRVLRTRRQDNAAAEPHDKWREEVRVAIDHDQEGDETEWLVVETLAEVPAESENGRSVTVGRAQMLDEHEAWAEQAARDIATRLGMPAPYVELLALAARLHDEGKKAARWQRAFRAPADGVYGKTRSRPDQRVLGGYRHELGSLPHAERDARVQCLDDDMRDLALHLIAAHHGNARPSIRLDGAEEPPSKLEQRARDIALRFARLEKRWGPWGLAWWESLLRAADQQASRRNDLGGHDG